MLWSDQKEQRGSYDILMKEMVDDGDKVLFSQIDARDDSKIQMDSTGGSFWSSVFLGRLFVFPKLPDDFFNKYFSYLQREHPSLTKIVTSPEKLKQLLVAQSTTSHGSLERGKAIYKEGKCYADYPYVSKEGKRLIEPTFLEIGQQLFGDALSAVKLHLIAKLMSDGHIEKGPIIDYEGNFHLSSKSFFLQEPKYAMEVFLRTVNELMAGRVKEEGNIQEIYRVFENSDWPEIVKEITKLTFREVENDPSKSTAIGPDQRKLIDKPVDFLKIYDIDPKKVIPSEKEIEKISKDFKK